MRFFEQKLSIGILFICIPLLFLPKINVMSIDAGESAGLRIDDFVLCLTGILLMWSHALSHQKFYKIECWILLITGFSFFSFFINQFLSSLNFGYFNAKIFYTARLLEYFIFFYVGTIAFSYIKAKTIITAFFLWNFLIMALQKVNVIGAISVSGYYEDVSTRVFGVASFPSEMGLILNLLFCYMIWDPSISLRLISFIKLIPLRQFLRNCYLYWMFVLFGTFIIFTGNRISIVALLVCFFGRFLQTFKLRSIASLITIMIFIPLLLGGIGFIITQSEGVYERSSDLFSFKNFDLFHTAWDNIDISKDPLSLAQEESTENYDLSWWIRIHKWLFAAKSYLSHPAYYLQGLGPGVSGAALDGGLLRILTEYGLIGVFLFWKFFKCIYRLNDQTKWMMISFLLNMIFFDAYLAYKTMSFLFFSIGYIFESQQYIFRNAQPTTKIVGLPTFI